MDKGLFIGELAKQLGVTEDTVINWEKRGMRPAATHIRKVMDFVPNVSKFFE